MYEGYISQYIPHHNHTRFARSRYLEGDFQQSPPAFGVRAVWHDVVVPRLRAFFSNVYELLNPVYQWWME